LGGGVCKEKTWGSGTENRRSKHPISRFGGKSGEKNSPKQNLKPKPLTEKSSKPDEDTDRSQIEGTLSEKLLWGARKKPCPRLEKKTRVGKEAKFRQGKGKHVNKKDGALGGMEIRRGMKGEGATVNELLHEKKKVFFLSTKGV